MQRDIGGGNVDGAAWVVVQLRLVFKAAGKAALERADKLFCVAIRWPRLCAEEVCQLQVKATAYAIASDEDGGVPKAMVVVVRHSQRAS